MILSRVFQLMMFILTLTRISSFKHSIWFQKTHISINDGKYYIRGKQPQYFMSSKETNELPIIRKYDPQERFWVTPQGLNIEVLVTNPEALKDLNEEQSSSEQLKMAYSKVMDSIFSNSTKNQDKLTVETDVKAPILFIHGSFHSAWCFAENYIDYFTAKGHPCYAVSLRGTSATGFFSFYFSDYIVCNWFLIFNNSVEKSL